jgi:hypothetical protein
MQYITDEDYEQAAAIGVSKKTLEYRINVLGWPKEKAITQKPRNFTKYPDDIKELAKKNGVELATVWRRVKRLGWSMEKAATEPMHKVEVIRCKDCMHFERKSELHGYCSYWDFRQGKAPNIVENNDYCSNGVAK